MKILRINTEYGRGGAALMARALHERLNEKNDFRDVFAYGRDVDPKTEKEYKFTNEIEIFFHRVIRRTLGIQGFGTYFSTRKLEKYIKDEKFDIIHLHNLHGSYINFSFIEFLKKNNMNVVWTLHDTWAVSGRCAFFFTCDRWKTGCGSCPRRNAYPTTFIDTSRFMWKRKKKIFTENWNPRIVTPSAWLSNIARKSYLKDLDIRVIHTGVDTVVFRPKEKEKIREKLNLPKDKKIILIIAANLNAQRKGVKYAFEALNHLQSKDWQVITIGKKIETLPKELMKHIRQLGYIFGTEALSDVYNASDVFWITSIDDNFPFTVRESMACGVPVIGFDVGGVSEQITKDCGFVVPSKDVKALAARTDELFQNEQMQKEFSENSRKRAVDVLSFDTMTKKYIELYESILNENKSQKEGK